MKVYFKPVYQVHVYQYKHDNYTMLENECNKESFRIEIRDSKKIFFQKFRLTLMSFKIVLNRHIKHS